MAAVSSIALGALALGGAVMNYTAGQKAAEAAEEAAQQDAALMEIRAKNAIKIGAEEAGAYKRNIDKLLGTQAANTAASGVVVGAGSSADIRSETEQLAQEDIDRIKNNAKLEAWGFQTQGRNLLTNAGNQAAALRNQGTASLLGGIAQAGASIYGKGTDASSTNADNAYQDARRSGY